MNLFKNKYEYNEFNKLVNNYYNINKILKTFKYYIFNYTLKN